MPSIFKKDDGLPKRFVLGEDGRSIIDTETNKIARYEDSVRTSDIEDYCEYLIAGIMPVHRIIWEDIGEKKQ